MIAPNHRHRRALEREARNKAIYAVNLERPGDGWEGFDCETCGEWVEGRMSGLLCECERARGAELIREHMEENGQECAGRILEDAGIPRRFRDRTFDTFEPRKGTEDTLTAAREWAEAFTLETQDGLLFAGPFGSGKTHLATAAFRRAIERTLVEGRYISAGDLVSQVRSGDPITWTPVERAIAAELLLLDDVGQETGTDFTRDVVARVIQGRYDEARPTLFTSNHGPRGMEGTLGGAIVSRLREMAEAHVILASDYRATKRGAA